MKYCFIYDINYEHYQYSHAVFPHLYTRWITSLLRALAFFEVLLFYRFTKSSVFDDAMHLMLCPRYQTATVGVFLQWFSSQFHVIVSVLQPIASTAHLLDMKHFYAFSSSNGFYVRGCAWLECDWCHGRFGSTRVPAPYVQKQLIL